MIIPTQIYLFIKMIKKIYEPIKEKHIIVDTSQSLKKTIAEVVNRLQNYEL